MAITQISPWQPERIQAGQNGRVKMTALFAFSTTDASGTIPTPLKMLDDWCIHALTAPAADEQIYLTEISHLVKGYIVVASGVLTITRTGASKTSGLVFKIAVWGFSS